MKLWCSAKWPHFPNMALILLVYWEYFGTQWKGKWQWCTFIYSVHWFKRAITVISPCRVAKTNSKYGICLLIKHIPASWVQPAGQQPPYWCAVCPGDFSWREALWRSQLHIISFKWSKWWEGQNAPPPALHTSLSGLGVRKDTVNDHRRLDEWGMFESQRNPRVKFADLIFNLKQSFT